jgi:hypothetical protein
LTVDDILDGLIGDGDAAMAENDASQAASSAMRILFTGFLP